MATKTTSLTDLIDRVLIDNDWTLFDLADALGCSVHAVGRWRRGNRRPANEAAVRALLETLLPAQPVEPRIRPGRPRL